MQDLQLLTPAEAVAWLAEHVNLKIRERTLRTEADNGKLGCKIIARKRYYRVRDLIAWLETGTEPRRPAVAQQPPPPPGPASGGRR